MADERRYSEQEVALILEQASAAQDQSDRVLPGGEGLTLAQVQDIAKEVGIDQQQVSRVANAVARGDLVPTQRRTYLGLPIGVGRTIDFGRPVSDAEWDRLVVVLRETFDAKGRVQREGNFRQWTNGNLQALLEPTEHGHRLRLRTTKGNAKMLMVLGAFSIVAGVATFFVPMLTGAATGDPAAFWNSVMLGLIGTVSLVSAGVQLPRWARTRASQMESVALRATEAPRSLP
jgi:hypothetical protein